MLSIKVENLSKIYQLGQIGTGTLAWDLERWLAKLRGKEDRFLKISDANDRTNKSTSEFVWSLKDINFEIEEGEAVGIIGRNGAGKSTLLKILSKITSPATGRIRVKGRISSLLEVGTGFHPELSGRENIYLNGAILGMRKREISRKFESIVEFAGVQKYIDTPVKRYSSGMYVRLAFAVAAHLESEILIVDEVLAVGDAEFQKRCLGKMGEISKGEGRTVLFVSHNMAAVKTLCAKGIVLHHGKNIFSGNSNEAVSYYLHSDSKTSRKKTFPAEFGNDYFQLLEITLNSRGKAFDEPLDEYQELELLTEILIKNRCERLHFTYVLNNEDGDALFAFSHIDNGLKLINGHNCIKCSFPKGFLNTGNYYLSFYVIEDRRQTIFSEKDILSFNIAEGERELGSWMGREPGSIKPIFEWTFDR